MKTAASTIDDALEVLVSAPLDYIESKREQGAMGNPDYANLVEKQAAGDGLSWEELSEKISLRFDDTPYPGEEFLRSMARRPVSAVVREALFAWQRVTRGWDDSATWSLDLYLAKTLSAQLTHLAETTHGWPSEAYPDFEDWQQALLENAGKLETYVRALFSSGSETDEGGQGRGISSIERDYEGAQEAMRWVADNFGSLWD